MIALRGLAPADLPALRAIQHAQHELPWSEDELRSQLHDAARGHGRNVVVAERQGAVAGCAGWVEAAPWLYGAPVLAVDEASAAPLVAHLIAHGRARGAERVRISATPGEAGKRAALEAAGFAPTLAFVTVTRPLGLGDGAAWAGPWTRVPFAELDLARFVDVLDTTFAGLANTRPTSVEELREDFDRPLTARAATAAWVDAAGEYVAFTQVTTDADDTGRFATIDAIGVRAAARGAGLGSRILDDTLSRLRTSCVEARALIASTNVASLALFAARGFRERARRTVYERTLTPG